MAIDQKVQKQLARYEEHCRRISKATFININESAADKLKRVRELEDDYIPWFEYYFPNYARVKCAWFHKQFAGDIINNTEIYDLLEIYRSGAKSVHADMGIPLYLMFTGRMKFMLLIGETERKAQKLLSACQAQLQFNKRLINDYGLKFKLGDWSSGEFLTTDGVRFMALGFGQNPRGVREEDQRPDYIVVDDVDNKRHVNNDRLMREGVEWIFEDLMGCFDETDGSVKRFVFANNNFHKNSITNRLKTQFKVQISKARENGQKSKYKILNVPAVKDLNTFSPNWPEKTSADYWRNKFGNTPYRSFMREYMHVHIQDGTVFRMEDMQWKKMLPLKEYDALVFYGDLSYKAAACHKGMILIGKKDREFHIIHVFLRQASRVVLAKWLYDLYESTGLKGCKKVRYWIEGLFSMDEFVNDFDAEGDERGYYIPVKPDKRPKDDKYDRIEASQSFFERRNVYFNIDEKESADQVELLEQYLAFEKGGDAPVDGPDAAEGAFSMLNGVTRKQKGKYRSGHRESRRY
ncbi:hypothetical protein [Butyricimonas paravirosa]|mgnify:CR=1 FL=1|jgi:hypothetical protein|uniref:hypothetical protein n=1 Tax=Butyricimonas paravirosa TaxID=1472417 RepID=UPI0022E4DF08|nr:hypothetical protein [Butyricimonas paravirosa]